MTMHRTDTDPESFRQLFERAGRKYLRAPVAVHFPEQEPFEEKVPETPAHQRRRAVLADSARLAFGDEARVRSDQFLYWDPSDPRKCLAPDLAVRRGPSGPLLPTWKVWEQGAPEVAVEIVSDSDRPPPRWKRGLERYRATGVQELLRFDPDDPQRPLRVWDRVDGDLIERQLDDPTRAECSVLGMWWVVVEDREAGPMLRLARDPNASEPLPSFEEAHRAAEQEREREAAARRAAEARVCELEAELRQGRR
jgi:Uma2 family endonuclease